MLPYLTRKDKQNVNKHAVELERLTVSWELLVLDSSSHNTVSFSGKEHWLHSEQCYWILVGDITETIFWLIYKLKLSNIILVKQVNNIKCEKLFDNTAPEMACKQKGQGIKLITFTSIQELSAAPMPSW